jgi:hypothetical protein
MRLDKMLKIAMIENDCADALELAKRSGVKYQNVCRFLREGKGKLENVVQMFDGLGLELKCVKKSSN